MTMMIRMLMMMSYDDRTEDSPLLDNDYLLMTSKCRRSVIMIIMIITIPIILIIFTIITITVII